MAEVLEYERKYIPNGTAGPQDASHKGNRRTRDVSKARNKSAHTSKRLRFLTHAFPGKSAYVPFYRLA